MHAVLGSDHSLRHGRRIGRLCPTSWSFDRDGARLRSNFRLNEARLQQRQKTCLPKGTSRGGTRKSSMSPIGKTDAQSGSSRYRKLKAMTIQRLWATTTALGIVFSPSLHAADASTSTPQIQGEHLRIEFDRSLRSRVVARFDGHETTMAPFNASETASIADRRLTEFSLVSQKRDRVNDDFGAGQRLVVVGKAGPLTKEVSVTIYDGRRGL